MHLEQTRHNGTQDNTDRLCNEPVMFTFHKRQRRNLRYFRVCISDPILNHQKQGNHVGNDVLENNGKILKIALPDTVNYRKIKIMFAKNPTAGQC
jgi:hypothetical protein